MRIAILGTGMVGRGLAARFAELGHSVTVGTRDPEGVTSGDGEYALWLAGQPTVDTRTFAQASAASEVVLNATNGHVSLDVLSLAGADNLAGKVLIDLANPIEFGPDGHPQVIPPPWLDPTGTPRRNSYWRPPPLDTLL